MMTVKRSTVFAGLTSCVLILAACGGSSTEDPTPQPPSAPTGLVATPGNATVSLTWSAVTGATDYTVYRATSTGALGTKSSIGTSSSPSFTDSSAVNDVEYFYQVTASNSVGESAGSSEVSATPSATAALPAPFIKATSLHWELPKVSGVPIQEVRICTDSTCATPVSDATVTMNTSSVPWSATNQRYEGNVMPAPSYHVTLTVTIPAGSLVAAGTYTATIDTYATVPTVTMPTAGTTWSRAVAHDLTWTAGAPTATTPGSTYVVGINNSVGTFFPVKTLNGPTESSIGSTTFTLPAGTLPAAGTYVAWIGIGTAGIVDGGGGVAIPGAATGSGLYTGYVSSYVAFTVTD